MTRNPIEYYVKARGVGGIDEIAEIFTGAEAAGRRVEAGRLVAPAAVERVFVHRQQFEVGETHPFCIWHQLVCQFAVAKPEVIVGMAAPGTEVHFINRDRRIKLVRGFARRRLFDFWRQIADKRRAFRAHLRLKGVRIGFDA